MPTSAALPDTTPQTRAHTDTHDATGPTHYNGTAASWRVSPKTAHAYNPRNAHRTLARRIQTHKPRTPARRPAQTAQSSPHAHRCAHATHSTAHCSDHPTRRPQKIAPSHTRPPLTVELSGCPASTGCCRRVGCRTSTTPCRTHEQPSCHTMAPDAAADPSQPPATHRGASHNINRVK